MSSTQIKYIALVSMVLDHIGILFWPDCIFFRIIGRLAFPLFAFSFSEGLKHNVSQAQREHHMKNLLVLAIVSEIPFDLFLSQKPVYPFSQNVILTFLLAEIGIYFYESKKEGYGKVILLIPAILASLIRADFGIIGVLVIYCFYFFRPKKQIIAIILLWLNSIGVIPLSLANVLYLLIITCIGICIVQYYNGSKGEGQNIVLKKAVHYSYPSTLLLLWGLSFLKNIMFYF